MTRTKIVVGFLLAIKRVVGEQKLGEMKNRWVSVLTMDFLNLKIRYLCQMKIYG